MLKKLIVILGPTAVGKSELAIKLAKKFNGEIVSADSRQIYKGMDIGTGKIAPDTPNSLTHAFTHQEVPHYCIDVVSPVKIFTVIQYTKLALAAIRKIFKKRKIPILCGGTGFYIKAIIDGLTIPKVEPDWKLRAKLEPKPAEELFNKLKKLDPNRAKTIENQNKRRLVRALEIIIKTKKPIPLVSKKPFPYPFLILGIKLSEQETEKRIEKRVKKMVNLGLEKEVANLVATHGWVPAFQTIGYQEWDNYFSGKIDKDKVKDLIALHTRQLVKRQMAWFKHDKRIKWIKKQPEAAKLVRNFLKPC